jgi:hypothetical protein
LSRGWLAGDVVEVRRDSDSTSQDFTASQITNGQMLSFVNHDTTSLYNSARYFNGTDVALTEITVSGDFSISFSFTYSAATSTNYLGRDTNNRINTFNGLMFLKIDGVGSSSAFNAIPVMSIGEVYDVTISRVGSTVSVAIAGLGSDSATISSADLFIDTIGGAGGAGATANGVIYDVNINGQAAYTGLGTSVTAWEDTIGSNDGTEINGAAYTGQPFDGFVSTWYDQSGNANDATQIATASQPKIVDGGALVTGGLDFDGVDDWMQDTTLAFSNGLLSVFSVRKLDDPTEAKNIIIDASDVQAFGSSKGFRLENRSSLARFGTNSLFTSSSNTSTSTQLQSGIKTSSDRFLYLDGSQVATDAIAGNVDFTGITQHKIGAGTLATDQSMSTNFFDGAIAEIIVYNSDESANRVGIETNINDHYSIYA